MKKQLFTMVLSAIVATFISSSAFAATVGWTDWSAQSVQTGLGGSASGTMTFGSDTVDVSLTGLLYNFVDGNQYYVNYPTTYGNLNPSDLIQERYIGNVTLSFSRPVIDPYFALVSVGQNANSVSYAFDSPFEIISSGPNQWAGANLGVINGNTFIGTEFNGVLKFTGTYDSLSFNITPGENWHGFNVGAEAPAPAPEPSSMVLGIMGLGSMLGFRRKQK